MEQICTISICVEFTSSCLETSWNSQCSFTELERTELSQLDIGHSGKRSVKYLTENTLIDFYLWQSFMLNSLGTQRSAHVRPLHNLAFSFFLVNFQSNELIILIT